MSRIDNLEGKYMKEKTLIFCLIIAFFNISLTAQEVDKTLWKKALKIHQDVLVIDTHAHGLISRRDKDTGNKRDTSQVDLVLMKQGGTDAVFFSLPIEDNPDEKISKRVSKSAAFVRDQLQRDVIKESKGPVVASHSNTRSLVSISRNIPDDILKKIAEKVGAVMVTFDSGMLSSDYHPPSRERTPIGILIDHIDHVAKLVGTELEETSH